MDIRTRTVDSGPIVGWMGCALLALGMIGVVPLAVVGQAPSWELRVCADPDDAPVSSRDEPGFDNRIVDILADELGARVSYVWTTTGFEYTVEQHLLEGECDLVMTAPEGAMGLLNTVPYYRSPFVFVYRTDRELDVRSLDDEVLRDLRIGTYTTGAPHSALSRRGLRDNIVPQHPLRGEPEREIVSKVLTGEVDLGLVYGPMVGHLVLENSNELSVVPVSPELDIPFTPMFSVWTMGVRPNDPALRDQLNLALARRWEDVQGVFHEYGVPLLSTPRPRAPDQAESRAVRVGVVLPMPSGRARASDVVGRAARMGALLTEGWLDRDPEAPMLEILLADAPDAAAAVRAAERLVATEGVTALVGGLGLDQARALSEIAERNDVLFLNVGAPSDALRTGSDRPRTFHVEASGAMYVDALVSWFAGRGQSDWFLVHDGSDEGRQLRAMASDAVEREPAARSVGEIEVSPGGHVFHDVFSQIEAADPQVVLLLLSAADQESFLSQYERTPLGAAVTGFPDPVAQTRDFYARFRQVAPEAGVGFRVSLWEPSLDGASEEVIRRFEARSGEPMDPTGWAAYAAVRIVYDAVRSTGSRDAAVLSGHLVNPEVSFDVAKGVAVSFDSSNRQLKQPLYVVKIDEEAPWGLQVSRQVGLAHVVDRYWSGGDLESGGVP